MLVLTFKLLEFEQFYRPAGIFESWIITNGQERKPNKCQGSTGNDNKLIFNFCCRLVTKTSYLLLCKIVQIHVA